MARATKGADAIGRGTALDDPATTTYDAFIVENTVDPAGVPDGLYPLRLGTWVRDAGTSGSVTEVGTGTALPDALTSTFSLFVIAGSADLIGEPDGAYYKYLGNWVRA